MLCRWQTVFTELLCCVIFPSCADSSVHHVCDVKALAENVFKENTVYIYFVFQADCFSVVQFCLSASSAAAQPSHLSDNPKIYRKGIIYKVVLKVHLPSSTLVRLSDSPSSVSFKNIK